MIEPCTIKGNWWLPDSETIRSGELQFTPETGARLYLIGSFDLDFFDESSVEIILGDTDSGPVTLIDCWYSSGSTRISNSFQQVTYNSRFVFFGHHFFKADDICFRNVRVQLFNLYQWLGKSGLEYEGWEVDRLYRFEYIKSPGIPFEPFSGCKGMIYLISDIKTLDIGNINLRETAEISLEFEQPIPFKDILQDIQQFTDFLTFCTFEQSYPQKIVFSDDEFTDYNKKLKRSQKKEIVLLERLPQNTADAKVRMQFEHLISFMDIDQSLPNIIETWCQKATELEPVFDLMMYTFKEKNKFGPQKFLSVVRALETFHRRIHSSNTHFSETDYKTHLANITASTRHLGNDVRDWLSKKLAYGNEPSLRQRIGELLGEYNNQYLQQKITIEYKDFIDKVVTTRNYHTHFDQKLEEKALKGKELLDATLILMGLLFTCLFKQLGIENVDISMKLKEIL